MNPILVILVYSILSKPGTEGNLNGIWS